MKGWGGTCLGWEKIAILYFKTNGISILSTRFLESLLIIKEKKKYFCTFIYFSFHSIRDSIIRTKNKYKTLSLNVVLYLRRKQINFRIRDRSLVNNLSLDEESEKWREEKGNVFLEIKQRSVIRDSLNFSIKSLNVSQF